MNRLQWILSEYAKQASCKIEVSVREEEDNIVIRWDHQRDSWKTFHEKEFPKECLQERINNYESKLK